MRSLVCHPTRLRVELRLSMEIEICTITTTWITRVDDQEFADREQGTAAGSVRERINAGEPIAVYGDVSGSRSSRVSDMAIFNPGHVVAVVEKGGRPARW
jgi:hypothetical protein